MRFEPKADVKKIYDKLSLAEIDLTPEILNEKYSKVLADYKIENVIVCG